jgi:RNA polymerase sigma-70 factor (ECF subfamily)
LIASAPVSLVKPLESAESAPSFASCVRAFEDEFDYLARCLRRHGVAPDDADDLVQDVFVVMCRRWRDYRRDQPLRPWLAGIAYHVARAHLRRRHREVPSPELDLEDATPAAEDQLLAANARALVLKVLASLPERHRTALILHELDGLAMNEVAGVLGIPLATAYTRVRRARLAFADLVKRHEQPTRPQHRALVPGIEALLAAERELAPARAELRVRALARARAFAPKIGAPRFAPNRPWIFRIASAGALAIAGAAGLIMLAVRSPSASAIETTPAPVVRGSAQWVGAGARFRGPAVILPGRGSGGVPRLTVSEESFVPRVSLARGLVGFWRFEDGPGSLTTRDLSAYGHDCVVHPKNGATAWTDAPRGMGLGPGSWVECVQPFTPTGGLEASAAAWVRVDRETSFHGTIVSRPMSASTRDYFLFAVAGNELVLHSNVVKPARLASPIPDLLHRWLHVAFSRRKDGLTKLFVNGVVVAEHRARPLARGPIAKALLIGADVADPGGHGVLRRFAGAIDDVLVYERALLDDEVAALAAGTEPAAPAGLALGAP